RDQEDRPINQGGERQRQKVQSNREPDGTGRADHARGQRTVRLVDPVNLDVQVVVPGIARSCDQKRDEGGQCNVAPSACTGNVTAEENSQRAAESVEWTGKLVHSF